MIISIASGKGGTGKTTVATNLALSLGDVQFFDCDVEEPNANIFIKSEIREREDVNVQIPVIDKNKCDFCGKCSSFCRYNAIAAVPNNVLVFPELCHSCGGCELVCPRDAIGCVDRTVGKIEYGFDGRIDFYHGLLNVGEIQAIPVIKALKHKIEPGRCTIIDAPPGTSCPVIETVNTSDYCILVTEPTPFGLHDLKLAVDVIRHLGIPFGVIINRHGNDFKNVETYCSHEKIPVLLKIPQSKEIAELYSQGIPFVKKLPEWHENFVQLFEKIQLEVKK